MILVCCYDVMVALVYGASVVIVVVDDVFGVVICMSSLMGSSMNLNMGNMGVKSMFVLW